jgi:hypothetical protein
MPLVTRREAAQAVFEQMFPEKGAFGRAESSISEELEVRVTNRGLLVVRVKNIPEIRYLGSLKTTNSEANK